jgi:hypothetical protein
MNQTNRKRRGRIFSASCYEVSVLSRHVAVFQIQGESSSEDEEDSLGGLPGISF